MQHRLRACLAGAAALLVSAAVLYVQATPRRAAADALQAGDGLQWYRGNLHTHSLWSDGDDYPEMIALWYREHRYDFLGFSDHNVLLAGERWTDVAMNKGKLPAFERLQSRFPENWVEQRTRNDRLETRLKTFAEVSNELAEPGRFLLIQGEEISDAFERLPIHLIGTNLKELVPPMHGEGVYETIQNNVNAVMAQRERTGQPMLVHVNHPNFGFAITAEDLMRLEGDRFFEVYNGHPGVYNGGDARHASTERVWDIVLTRRIAELGLPFMYGLAVDDGHNYHNIPSRASEPGRGWVMVLARELTPAAIVDALEQGQFYASSGVYLRRVQESSTSLEIEVEPELGVTYTIDFIGTNKNFDARSEPVLDDQGNPVRATRRYSADVGRTLQSVAGTTAAYRFTGDELYVRARVTSDRSHPNPSSVGEFERAWSQPVKGPAAPR